MKLEDRLPAALDRIAATTPVNAERTFDPDRPIDSPQNPRSLRMVVLGAAAIVVALGVGGLIAVANIDNDRPVTNAPPTSTPAVAPSASSPTSTPNRVDAAGPAGALVLDSSTGMRVVSVQQGVLRSDSPSRWYATSSSTPETGPYLRVFSFDGGVRGGSARGCMLAAPATTTVTLDDGSTACLETRELAEPFGRIAIDRIADSIVIEGTVSDNELIAAANHLTPAATGAGYEISTDGLPVDVTNTGTGWAVSDFAATSVEAGDDPMIQVNWTSDSGASIFYVATTDPVAWVPNLRLGYDTVSDVTVREVSGFTRTLRDQPSYLGLVWHDNGITYQVGSQQLDEAEVLQLVEQMRAVTQEEWEALTAAATTDDDDATIDVATTIAN